MITILVIACLALLVIVHELGHFFAAKLFKIRVDEFGIGFPPRIAGIARGETNYTINALPLGGFVRIHGENGSPAAVSEESAVDRARNFSFRPAWQRAIVLIAGVCMNIVIATIFFVIVFTIGAPQHLMVSGTVPESPAARAGIQNGDVITKAQFQSVVLVDPIDPAVFIAAVNDAAKQPVLLTVGQGSAARDITVTPETPANETGAKIGVYLVDIGVAPKPFLTAVRDGVATTWSALVSTISGLSLFVEKLVSGSSDALKAVTGPVGIFTLSTQAGSLGIVYLLELAAMISINLAVLNLIPIPALDGGRLFVVLIEAVKRSPVPIRTQRIVNTIGFVLLAILMVVVTVKDVSRLLQ